MFTKEYKEYLRTSANLSYFIFVPNIDLRKRKFQFQSIDQHHRNMKPLATQNQHFTLGGKTNS